MEMRQISSQLYLTHRKQMQECKNKLSVRNVDWTEILTTAQAG